MKKKTLIWLVLFIIILLALILRLYNINRLPVYADETGHYRLLQWILNGKENLFRGLYNKIFHGTFTFTWLFGLTPLGVRFGSALYGSSAIFFIYLLAKKLSKNNVIALVSAILMAVLPWSYMIGRIGHTHIPLLIVFTILQVYFFLRSNKITNHLVSLVFLGLTTIYYPSMIIVAPGIFLLVFIETTNINLKQFKRPVALLSLILFFIILIYAAKRFDIFNPADRALDLAIWRDVNTPYDTDKYRALSWNSQPSLFSFGLPPEQLANKLFLNRITANLSVFTRNYLSFFSPEWLFLKGDAILRHSTGMVGAFYPFLLPFMFYGAFRFFRGADSKTRNLFLVWILISPVPAALTKDGAGYLLRAVTMLPFLTYFCALGIVDSFGLIGKKWRWPYGIIIALIGLYSAWSFFYGYFHVYPALSARAYEYGFKELSDFQVASEGKTMLIVWDGYYHVGDFLFWQKVPLVEYEKMKITPIGIGETTFWKTLPNLYFTIPKDTKNVAQFIKDYQPAFLVLPDRYFVKYSDDLLELTAKKVYEIPYPDKTTAFTVYTLK